MIKKKKWTPSKNKLLIGAGFFAAVILFSTGFRNDIFLLFFANLIIVYYLSAHKHSFKPLTLLPVFAIFLFVLGFFRNVILFSGSSNYAIFLFKYAGSSIAKQFLYYIFFNLSSYIEGYGLIVESVPKLIPFMKGKTLLMTLSTALPGNQATPGEYLKTALGLEYAGGGLNPTMIGELYWQGGVSTIFIIMFCYGVICQTLYLNMQAGKTEFNVILYGYVYTFMTIGIFTGVLSQLTLFFYLALIAIIHFSVKKA